jgi:ABC-type transport system involved in multi-copper enzyme maturation permease subunit
MMSADAVTLVRMDLLKLSRRRGLIALALVIAAGTVSVFFAANAIRHGTNPLHAGPAGGTKNFESATNFLGTIAVVIAAMIGVTAGAGDAELGVLRDLVATGRSRATLFVSRAVAGAALTVVLLGAALVVVTVASVALAGSAHGPSLSNVVRRDAAVLAFGALAALVCVGIAAFARSRGPVMGSVIAFGALISQVLLQVSFLGDTRAVLPLGSFLRLAGHAGRGISGLHFSVPVAIAVLVAWAAGAVAAGGWWALRVEV